MNHYYRKLSESELIELCNSIIYKYDQDKDGNLCFKEIYMLTHNHPLFKNINPHILFTEIDVSEDGRITKEELLIYLKKRAEIEKETGTIRIISKMRCLNPEEIDKLANQIMYKYDNNYDGVLSRDEVIAYFKCSELFQGRNVDKLLERADLNRDSKISRDELKQFLEEFVEKKDEMQSLL